jgi:amidophosphoribosyltransferase
VAFVRLFKPVQYYHTTYHDRAWGIHKVCLLLEKQRNRGQDSVGLSVMQCDMPSGYPFMKRYRFCQEEALKVLLSKVNDKVKVAEEVPITLPDIEFKKQARVIGEIYLGHLRYGTHGGNKLKRAQPYLYENSIPAKCLLLAGNFNMTNNREIMQRITYCGINPIDSGDTHLLITQLSYAIDRAYEQALSTHRKTDGDISIEQASREAAKEIDIAQAIRYASAEWDGGYMLAGAIGNGDSFIMRDPAGIRSGYFYYNDEYFAAASERSALMNAFNLAPEKIQEVQPGTVIVIKKNGDIRFHQFKEALPLARCVFERIYFSRPCDPDIYKERKSLGVELAKRLYHQIDNLQDAIFCYIPNTAEISFYGLVQEMNKLSLTEKLQQVRRGSIELSDEKIQEILHQKCRVEKLLFKDQSIRTFIANEAIRSDLISKVYDATRGIVKESDTLITIDDSIVRGATLRQSIIKCLITLNPKKIIILSAAPIVLYPDCYGVDISQIGSLIGFQAAIALTKERGNQQLIQAIYQECLALKEAPQDGYNPIKKIYDQFSQQELENKIAQMVYPTDSRWRGELQVIYQSVEGMHKAIPDYTGDWYFTGNYPTPGGFKVVITSYINWYQNNNQRAY